MSGKSFTEPFRVVCRYDRNMTFRSSNTIDGIEKAYGGDSFTTLLFSITNAVSSLSVSAVKARFVDVFKEKDATPRKRVKRLNRSSSVSVGSRRLIL